MKKFLSVVAVLLALLIAGVLVVPGMIDWNHYKSDIQAQAKTLTGRDLMISGDIKITILPAPALIANGVALANLPGASSPHMARLKLLEIRIALAPLLAGRVEVNRIKLVDPVVELEVLADGRKNWTFDTGRGNTAPVPPAPGAPSAAPTAPTAAPSTAADAPSAPGTGRIAFENFTITNGTLIYRDAKAATVERVEQITATFSAASLNGPFESGGSLKLRGLPLRYDVNVGDIIQGRTVPFNLKLSMAPGDATLQIVGTAVGLESAPKIKGKVKGSGTSLARLIEAAETGTALPTFLNQDFTFEGNIAGAVDGAAVKDLALRFGSTQATGEITVEADKALTVITRIAASRIDLDKWLAIADQPAAGADSKQASKASATLPQAKPSGPTDEAAAFAIPRHVSGSLSFSAEAVTFRGGLIKHAVVNAELNNGEITVSQLSAQFPGGSDLAVFGFVTATEGQPRFEGELESTVNDFHGVMKWLGADIEGLSSDRLRKLTLATRVAASPKLAEFRNIDLQFDSSRLTGGLTVALTKRPSFGADITLDRLNLDAYLPDAWAKPVNTASPATKKPAAGQAAAPVAGAKTDDPLAALKPLTEVDANLKARVGTLVFRANQIKDVTFDGTLHNGRLEIRRLAVAKMAGASASVAGIVDKLGDKPTAAGLKFDVTADDLPRFLRFAGMNPPVPAKDLGAVTLNGRLDGALMAPRVNLRVVGAGATAVVDGQIDGIDAIPAARKLKFQLTAGDAVRVLRLAGIDAPAAKSLGPITAVGEIDGTLVQPSLALTLKAAGGELAVTGPVSVLAAGDMVNFNLTLRHPDTAQLLKTLGGGYRPAGKIGGLDVAGKLTGGPAALTLSGLNAKLGDAQVSGNIAVALAGARPNITATLNAGAIVLDPFLPAQKTAALDTWPGGPRVVPAATAAPGAVDERWSRDPIDLSGLGAVDGEVAFKSPLVQFQKYRLETADVGVRLANGRLTADRLNGRLFGGALSATAVASTTKQPRFETVFSLEAMNVNQATAAVTGQALASGTMSMKGKLQASGGSVADMVAGLGGDGAFQMKGVDVSQAGGGSAMAGAFGLVSALNQFTGVLGGAKPGDGLADISGSFQMTGGVARSGDLKLVSGLGNGVAQGAVDLARWRIDVSGQMQLSPNVLTALLERRSGSKVTQAVPFYVQGRLDAPNVRLDTSKLPGAVLPVPGVDKLLKKAPPAVGDLLQGILGGGQPTQDQGTAGTQPAPTQAQPQQQQQQQPTTQQKKIRPEDLLKDLFKR